MLNDDLTNKTSLEVILKAVSDRYENGTITEITK